MTTGLEVKAAGLIILLNYFSICVCSSSARAPFSQCQESEVKDIKKSNHWYCAFAAFNRDEVDVRCLAPD